MEMHNHSLSSLFDQLGLASNEEEIKGFIRQHRIHLSGGAKLHHADFWNDSQAAFLKEAKAEDADWSDVVDQLDVLLRTSSEE
ncbi:MULTISPECIES: DUF2789 domain-containing protein [Vibrio]|uniref:DUF2789 family protein n=1 Tax=Vibrio algicola TaxID=2662262 RepID=A0A5Q0THY0_9VIBR|nr:MULTISPECIES: DUF2789 domain-containing protein [Vibrio]MBD1576606.1 DUF2789 domain-containing protein [Vibrio sp. S11_S32]